MTNEITSGAQAWREQGLSATVHRACPKCTAPGVFVCDERIRAEYPACYASYGDPRCDTSVGDRCPQCGAFRGPSLMTELGEIWRKRFGG